MTRPPGPALVLLLNALWDGLQVAGLRWKHMAPAALDAGLAARVTVVDFPHFRRRAAVDPTFPLIERRPSWDDRIECLGLTLPAGPQPGVLDMLAWRRAGRALHRALAETQPGGDRVLVSVNPLYNPLLRHVPAAVRAFDAEDDWRAYDAVFALQARIEAGYRAARNVDVVSANSQVLAQTLADELGRRIEHVGNGVDLRAFDAAGVKPAPQLDLPDGPLAVYVGSLQGRVDFQLLAAVAERLRGTVTVVLAGPVDDAHRAVVEQGPWSWVGAVPGVEVPALLAQASVGIVPHLRTPLTESMEPLKVLEYLAAGLPVVSTPLPALEALAPGVTQAADAEAFAAATRAAAARGRDPGLRLLVADRDWSMVVRRLFDLYDAHRAAPGT